MIHQTDSYSFQTLMNGHFFGEAEMLKCIDFTYFGDIVVDSPEVTVLYISTEDFLTIPLYERNMIKKFADQRSEISMLGVQYARRYKVEVSEYYNFY